MTPEGTLKKTCKQIAKNRGCTLYPASFRGRKGFPDSLLLCPAQALIFVEFKAIGGRLSEHQVSTIYDLRAAGAEVWVVYRESVFGDDLRRVLNERPIRLG